MNVLVIKPVCMQTKQGGTFFRLCDVCIREGHQIEVLDIAPDADARALCIAMERAHAVLFLADETDLVERMLLTLAKLPHEPGQSHPAVGVILCETPNRTALVEAYTEFTWCAECDSLGVLDDERGVLVALELLTAPYGADSPF